MRAGSGVRRWGSLGSLQSAALLIVRPAPAGKSCLAELRPLRLRCSAQTTAPHRDRAASSPGRARVRAGSGVRRWGSLGSLQSAALLIALPAPAGTTLTVQCSHRVVSTWGTAGLAVRLRELAVRRSVPGGGRSGPGGTKTAAGVRAWGVRGASSGWIARGTTLTPAVRRVDCAASMAGSAGRLREVAGVSRPARVIGRSGTTVAAGPGVWRRGRGAGSRVRRGRAGWGGGPSRTCACLRRGRLRGGEPGRGPRESRLVRGWGGHAGRISRCRSCAPIKIIGKVGRRRGRCRGGRGCPGRRR